MTGLDLLLVAAGTLVTALATALLTPPVLRRLPEPVPEPGPAAEHKVPYRALARPPFVLACTLVSAGAAGLAWAVLPMPLQPLWTVLAVGGVLLAAIDARTTWLPARLVHGAWAAMAVAALISAAWASSWTLLLRTAGGAAVAGGLYLLVWLVSRGGFGFGDVRFAPLIGAATAADSVALLTTALVAGTLVGGLHGLVRLVRRRRGPFPYAPAMLGGGYLAVLLSSLA